MNGYQTLQISYPVLALTVLSFIMICFYAFLYKINGRGLFVIHFGFLILITIENIAENLFPPTQGFPINVKEGTGYVISSFWPYYVYKYCKFPPFKRYREQGAIIMIPSIFFFFIFYPFWGSFELARRLGYIIPACYAIYAIPTYLKSAKSAFAIDHNKVQYREYLFLFVAITFWSISPIVRIYLKANRSIMSVTATLPIILFNVYIIIKELKLLTNAKVNTAKNESSIDLSDYALTPREAEVINLAYQGKTYKEIGKDLFISEARVKQIVSNAYRKLGVESKMELIKKMK